MQIPPSFDSDMKTGLCTYDLQDILKKNAFKCYKTLGGNPTIKDCDLPIEPGKYAMDGISFTLADEFEVPDIVSLGFEQFFGEPIKLSFKMFGADKAEIICLDGMIQIALP